MVLLVVLLVALPVVLLVAHPVARLVVHPVVHPVVLLEVLPEVLPVAQVAQENALIHVEQVVSLIVLHHAVVHVGHRVEGLVLDNVQTTVIVNVWEKPRAVVFLVVWELAEKAGVSIATITKMGKDGAVVSSDVLVKICTALDCTMDDIVEILPN